MKEVNEGEVKMNPCCRGTVDFGNRTGLEKGTSAMPQPPAVPCLHLCDSPIRLESGEV